MANTEQWHLFEVCLDPEKKSIMIKALEDQLDLLERSGASRIRTQETRQLKEEIEKMKIC